MSHVPTQASTAATRAASAGPRRQRNAALTVAVMLLLAGIAAMAPLSASATAGRPAQPGQPNVATRTESGRGTNAGHRPAVRVPPTVSVGNGPDGLAVDPATHTLYSSNQNANNVSVVNTAACNAQDTAAAIGRRTRSGLAPARKGSLPTPPPVPSTWPTSGTTPSR